MHLLMCATRTLTLSSYTCDSYVNNVKHSFFICVKRFHIILLNFCAPIKGAINASTGGYHIL